MTIDHKGITYVCAPTHDGYRIMGPDKVMHVASLYTCNCRDHYHGLKVCKHMDICRELKRRSR